MDATRLDVRLKRGAKELILRAAESRNETLTQFVVSTLSEAAERVLAAHERLELSNRDRDKFLALLDSPPRPNTALKRAAKRYRRQQAG